MQRKKSSVFIDNKIIEYLAGIFATREDVSSAIRAEIRQTKEAVVDELLTRLSKELWISGIDLINKFLDIADELSATKMLVVPLFRSMGYEHVRFDKHEQRNLEFGQDIREMKLRLPSGHVLYFVAQVKKKTLRSSTRNVASDIESILLQLEKSLEKKIFDYDLDSEVRPDHAYLVVLGSISKDSRVFLEERISAEKRRKILILNRDDLIQLCQKYGLPLEAQAEIKKCLEPSMGRSITQRRTPVRTAI